MADGGISIGNYKGVMLCNRPFNGSSTKVSTVKNNNSSAPFVTSGSSTTWGQNVPILNEPLHAVKRDKSNTALSKHKKWLHDLKKERERLELAMLESEKKKIDQRKRFADREAKMRSNIRSSSEGEGKVVSKKKGGLPMWAMTEDIAEDEMERQEEDEVDALVDFAQDLDIDEFLNNVEMKTMMDQMNQKMNEIESEVVGEETAALREQREYERSIRKLTPLNAENLARLSDDRYSQVDDDSKSVALSVLSECKSIRSVHSSRSMNVLTQKALQKLNNASNLDTISEVHKPRIIVHDEEKGSRILSKKHPSNLPYIHRNPAI